VKLLGEHVNAERCVHSQAVVAAADGGSVGDHHG